MKEGEVGGVRKAGPENAIINHREVKRRNEEIIAVSIEIVDDDGGDYLLRRRRGVAAVECRWRRRRSNLDSPAHLGTRLVLMVQFHTSKSLLIIPFTFLRLKKAYSQRGAWDRREYSFGFFFFLAAPLNFFLFTLTVEKEVLLLERERVRVRERERE